LLCSSMTFFPKLLLSGIGVSVMAHNFLYSSV